MALGKKTGGGSRKGRPNRANAARERAAAASGLMPLDFMLNLLRTEDAKFEDRKWAANAAAPYLHPKLANVDIGNRGDKPFQVTSVETDKKLL